MQTLNGVAETRHYLGGLEFVNGLPEAYNFGDGRVVWLSEPDPVTGNPVPTPRVQFRLHDHLGNTVVFFWDKDNDGCVATEAAGADSEILQRLLYYPFGMPMEGLSDWDTEPGQAYQYNGKERDTISGWYDYGARWYDVGSGRWLGVDPLAGEMPGWSPYCYGFDNPVLFVDPDGRVPLPVVTGLIGAAGGLIYGLASGKSWKQTAALTLGGFVAGATMGMGGLGVTALGGVKTIGVTGASYIMMGSGIGAGFLGNAVEQGTRIALGESDSFNEKEFVLSGVFGISEILLGPMGEAAGGAAKNMIRESVESTVKHPSRAQIRRAHKDLVKQIRGHAPNGISKHKARKVAAELIQSAREQKAHTLEGTIRFTEKGVDVSVSGMQTTASEEAKTKILEDGNN